jgi:YD repeat-containing protein
VNLSSSTVSNNGNGISTNTATVAVSGHSTISNNSQYELWFNLPTGYSTPASSIVASDVTGNGSTGIYIGANGDYPLSQMPWGIGNNIYANGGKQLETSGYPGFGSAAVKWKGNFWGSDVYYWYSPIVCRNPTGHLAYRSSTANPPDGPIGSSIYLDGSFTTLCARDNIDIGPNDVYAAYLDGSPVEPLYQTFVQGGRTINATDATDSLADPVNSATGSFTQDEADLSLPGTGVSLLFERTYNSLDLTSGELGQGWTDAYAASLAVASNGDVTVRGEDGQQIAYTKQPDGSFVGAPGALSKLVAITGGYELTRKDLVKYSFNSQGRLSAIVDRNGQGVSLSYGGDGKLATATDVAGRTFTFTHNATTGLLTNVSAPGGRSVGYGYTGGLLTSVTDVAGKTWTFTYDNRGFLTKELDPLGHTVFQNTFGADGRVTEQYDGLNNKTTFSWDQPTQTLTATDPRDNAWKDVYSNNVLKKRLDPAGDTTQFGHDDPLNTSAVTAPGGSSTTSLAYDTAGNLLTATAPASLGSAVKTFTYETSNNLSTVTDARGKVTSYGYDSAGNTTSVTLDGQQVGGATYDASGRTLTSTDGRGKTTTYTYDTNGNVASVTDPLGNKTTFTYDGAGRVLTKVAPLGNVTGGNPANYTTTYTYDAAGRVLTDTDELGRTISNTYDDAGRKTSTTDANGHTTTYGYDNANHLIQITEADPDGTGPLEAPVTKYTYDAAGNRVTMIGPRGNCSGCNAAAYTTTYTYDLNNRLAASTTPKGEKTSYSYDANGNLAAVVDPRGNVQGANPDDYKTTYTYDAAGRLLTTTDPLGHVTTNHYDAVGNLDWTRDANLHQTSYGYDAAGRILTVTAPDGGVTTYAYDGNGNLLTRTDDNAHTTSYGYNDASLLSSVTGADPDGAGSLTSPVTSYSYDGNGNLALRTDANGNATPATGDGITAFSYDRANRLTGIDYSDSTPDVTLVYDNAGNRTSMTDGAGTVTSVYDNLNRLSSVTRGTDAFSYVYDIAGNVTRRTYPDSTQIDYTFDEDDRLASVTSGGVTTSYGYDAASQLTQTTLPSGNGYVETRSYDRAGRLTEVKNATGASVLSDFVSTLDAVGNPTQIVQSGAVSSTETYSYDANDRLLSVCFQAGSCPDGSDPFIRWSYDKVGNRLTEARPAGTTSYSYDALDRLTQAGSTSYGYDADGNETSAGAATLGYDLANRLKTFTSGGATTTYSYGGDGARLQASTGSQAAEKTNFLWDTNLGLPQLALERDGNNSLLRRYLYGAGRISMSSGAAAFYYHVDSLGSVRNLTDGTGGTNSNGGPINPFTGRPVQPPPGLSSAQRLAYVRARTHVDLGP